MLRLANPVQALGDCMLCAAQLLEIDYIRLRDDSLVPAAHFFEDPAGIAVFLDPAGILYDTLYRQVTDLAWPFELHDDQDTGLEVRMVPDAQTAPFTVALRLMLWLLRAREVDDGVLAI